MNGDEAGILRRRPVRLRTPLNAHLHVAAFQLELGNIFLDQELDQFLKLFLIHRGRTDFQPLASDC